MHNLENVLILKIYFQLGVKTIEISRESTLELLFEKCCEMFNVVLIHDVKEADPSQQHNSYIMDGNLRIRLFNPVNDTKLDTYRGKENNSLEELGIRSYQNFILEPKNNEEEFEDYIPGFMSIRVALSEDNKHVTSLEDRHLKLHKVSINRSWSMLEIAQCIVKRRREILELKEDGEVCVIKRHQNDEYLYHEIINLPEYHPKTAEDVGLFESEVVFVEPDQEQLFWPQEFENEVHRISVKYTNSATGESSTILTDSRLPTGQLKDQLCALIGQVPAETIVRRGNRSGMEIKNLEASLKDNRFISGTSLYLEKGLPARMGEIRVQLFLASDAAVELSNRLHEFEFLADVPVDSAHRASQVKVKFAQVVQQLRGLELDPASFRIREKVNDKMGKIYR